MKNDNFDQVKFGLTTPPRKMKFQNYVRKNKKISSSLSVSELLNEGNVINYLSVFDYVKPSNTLSLIFITYYKLTYGKYKDIEGTS